MASNPPRPDPPSVRVITAAAAAIRRRPAAYAALAAAAVLLVWVLSGIYAVRVDESAALLRFGRLVDGHVLPGLHVRLPWGLDAVRKAPTGKTHSLTVSNAGAEEISLLTGDENLIRAVAIVQYKITGLADYLYRTESPEAIVNLCVRAALVEATAVMNVDDVLTTGKAAIQNDVRKTAQEMLNGYRAGVTLLSVNLRSVVPPAEAEAAFRKVSDAKAEAARAVNAAESDRDKSVNLARGEAGKMEQEAAAAATERTQQADGAAERFESVLAQKKATPKLTTTDLYMDTIAKALARVKIVMLAPGKNARVGVNLVDRPAPEKPSAERQAAGQ